MILLYQPRIELKQFVSRIMLVHYQLDKTLPKPTNPVPPQPEHCLYFYPYDKVVRNTSGNPSKQELSGSVIVGPKLHSVDLTFGYNTMVVIVCFHPGGLYRFLQIPMNEILDHSIDSALVFGRDIDNIIEQINTVRRPDQIVQIIEGFLIRKAKKVKTSIPIDDLLTQILHFHKPLNVDELAKEACVSIRQLERQFKERTGVSPKVFSRLIRFSKAWTMRQRDLGIPWSQIAYTCNYADQMHLIRDFKDFAGVTPGVLQATLEKSPLRLLDA